MVEKVLGRGKEVEGRKMEKEGRGTGQWKEGRMAVRKWLCGRVPDLQSGGCGFESQPGLLCTKVYSAFHPSGVGK